MSGIAGIYRFQSSVQPELLNAMLDAQSHRGPDARQTWHEGPVSLAACLLRTTPESENETPVTADASARFQLVWDGRLDNRAALLKLLDKEVFKNAPDTNLFLFAWQAWGKDCLQKLEGEFAFALWDRKTQTLFAGRDRVGLKPFHYSWNGRSFCFSSEIKPLFKALGTAPDFDDEMILSFLSYRNFKNSAHERTFFKNISRLAPSHCLIVQDGELRTERYASWDLETVVKQADPREYAEQLREILKEAVAARLRSQTPATALLSGGHDSSAIVSLASKMHLAGNLEALNYYSDDERMDERAYASCVAEAAGVPFHAFFAKTRNFSDGLGEFLRQAEAPMINTSRNTEPFEFLQNRGRRVVLSGEGGDQVLDEFGLASDLLAHFRFTEFMSKSESFSREFNDNPGDFRRESINSMLPETLKNFRRRLAGNVPPAWINKKTAREINFTSTVLKSEKQPRFHSFAQAATFQEVTRPYAIMKLELEERAYALHGLEIRYPYLDRRVIQFMLSLPWQVRASGTRKQLLKEAMKGIVPAMALERTDKADHTSETDAALKKLLHTNKAEVILNRSGLMGKYIHFPAAGRLIEKYLSGQKNLRFEVWFLMTMDQWLQQFNQGDLHEGQEAEKEVSYAASH